MAKKETVK